MNQCMGQDAESIIGFIFQLYILYNNTLPFSQIAALKNIEELTLPRTAHKISPARVYLLGGMY